MSIKDYNASLDTFDTELVEESPAVKVAAITPIGVTAALVGVDGAGSNAAPLVGTEARLDAIEAKVDALIAALKA